MQRVLIIGCSGSGKSTFARKLAAITQLPLYYLDSIWHKADRSTVSREDFDRELDKILVLNKWIIDGNFQRTLERRLSRCDTVFLFDLPLSDCLRGVEQRIGKERPEMPWIEQEFDEDFKQWIINFKNDRLPEIMRLLSNAVCTKIIFKSREKADSFLRALSQSQCP